MKNARWWLLGLALVLASGYLARYQLRAVVTPVQVAIMGRATVEERLAEHGPSARARLQARFAAAGISYPPHSIVLAGFKQENVIHLYAAGAPEALRFVHAYPVLAASGELGPKVAEGDRQVPEGIYRIESLNPNSRFHLSLRLDYPNQFDRAQAQEEGRQALGGDIMIHGAASSIGCLAIGDPAIEELFVLVADVGRENASVILSPVDLRTSPLPAALGTSHSWAPELYEKIRAALSDLPAPPG
jgi:murein L,D-transpeptidase YafK